MKAAGWLLAVVALPAQAAPSRVAENVVTQAEDAFGASINRESIGLYASSNVRGFSPTAAGNVRIDGLYFDQVWGLNPRLRQATNIRVGISAQGFPFPAPTGVVDYSFRRPGRDASLSAFASADSYGALALEADASLPLVKNRLSLGVGGALYRNSAYNGTTSFQHIEAVSLRWTPSDSIEILPFWIRSDIHQDTIGPLYRPAGDALPPDPARRLFVGPRWAVYDGHAVNYGGLARWTMGANTQLRAGLFRSFFDNARDTFTFLDELRPDGRARLTAIVDPPTKFASTSGEVRLTQSIADGARLHTLNAMVRARDADRRYAGTAFLDFGPYQMNERIFIPEPPLNFSAQIFDQVEQVTGGLAYGLRWKGVGEISAGLQKTSYRKRISFPTAPAVRDRATPWLWNATLALDISKSLVLYASHATGLEESGVAPAIAANRNDALPAIQTRQTDAGLRLALTNDLKLIAGWFSVEKPYFNLDEANVWRDLGTVRNSGFELSLSGKFTRTLGIVAGAVLLDADVTGDGVALGRIGRRPVNSTPIEAIGSLNWDTPVEGLAVDLGLTHEGPRESTRLNLVRIPPRTLVNLGARQIFSLGGKPALARLTVTNLFNVYGFRAPGAGAYDLIPGRVANFSLTWDL